MYSYVLRAFVFMYWAIHCENQFRRSAIHWRSNWLLHDVNVIWSAECYQILISEWRNQVFLVIAEEFSEGKLVASHVHVHTCLCWTQVQPSTKIEKKVYMSRRDVT